LIERAAWGRAQSQGKENIVKKIGFAVVWVVGYFLAGIFPAAHASSHREALAILNEPCADNTDTYAWVSNVTHDKL
jgi:hypothetical protein